MLEPDSAFALDGVIVAAASCIGAGREDGELRDVALAHVRAAALDKLAHELDEPLEIENVPDLTLRVLGDELLGAATQGVACDLLLDRSKQPARGKSINTSVSVGPHADGSWPWAACCG